MFQIHLTPKEYQLDIYIIIISCDSMVIILCDIIVSFYESISFMYNHIYMIHIRYLDDHVNVYYEIKMRRDQGRRHEIPLGRQKDKQGSRIKTEIEPNKALLRTSVTANPN